MAVELASAYVSLIPTLRGASKSITSQLGGVDVTPAASKIGSSLSKGIGSSLKLESVGAQFTKLGGQITGVGKKLNKGITMPVVGATTAAAGLVGVLGFKRLVGIDTARGQFKGLGYDADKVMEQVDKGVTNTALSMADGASMAVGILATGAVPMEKLEDQIKRTANVSAAYGVEGSHAANLLNAVLTKNKVTYGDLSQMQANGIPIISQLADHYGVAGDEIEKMAREGKISIEDMNKVIDKNAGAAAEEYGKTWAGVTANIKSNLGRLGAEVLDGVFPKLKSQAEDFLQVLKSDQAKAFAQQLGGMLTDAFTKISGAIKGAIEWFTGLSPVMQKTVLGVAGFAVAAGPVLIVVGKIATGIGALISVGGSMVGVITKLIPAFKALNAVMKANIFGLIVTAITAVVMGLVWFFTQTEIGQQIWAGFMGFLQDSWTNIVSFFQTGLAIVSALWTTVWTGVSDFFTGLWSGVVTFFSGVWTAITSAVNVGIAAVKAFISAGLNLVKNIWANGWQWHITLFQKIWEGIKSFAKSAIDWVRNAISSGVTATRAIWSNVWGAIASFFSNTWNRIVGFAQSAIANVRRGIQVGVNAIRGLWNSVWSGISGFFSTIWGNIVSAASSFMGSVQSTFQAALNFIRSIPSTVVGYFSGLGARLVASGKALITGFVNGIKQGFSKAVGAVKDGLAKVRSFFPFSPAKEGPFSGRGWVAYSGVSVGKTFTESVADSLSDGRKAISGELDTMQKDFDREAEAGFTVRAAVPAVADADASGTAGAGGVTIHVDHMEVRDESDIKLIGQDLWTRANRAGRARGRFDLGGAVTP
ncbi:phage tail protein [Glutamicibacter creatinolyticus]|uniref:phage tail protein n=1 Tax=Glutamicibacter creatinolyticus TaxID=162496 RepID=UPI00321763C6